jgi:formate dehydrogenase subunit gamma
MSSSDRSSPQRLKRFSRAERAVHRTLAVLMLVCIATAADLYNGALGIAVGHRRLVELIHVYSGLALPVPLLAGLGFAAYRADVSRLNRFTPADWTWLRSRTRRDGSIGVGKFNAGQKLNSALTAGSVAVLLGSGLLMFFPDLVRLSWRTGATLVHDWFALGVGLLVFGHIAQAVRDPEARRGMRTGHVSRSWAREQHREWAD